MIRLAAPESPPDDIGESLRQAAAVQAWNLMAGEIQWGGLPAVMEYVGTDETLDLFIARLAAISTHVNRKQEDGDG